MAEFEHADGESVTRSSASHQHDFVTGVTFAYVNCHARGIVTVVLALSRKLYKATFGFCFACTPSPSTVFSPSRVTTSFFSLSQGARLALLHPYIYFILEVLSLD